MPTIGAWQSSFPLRLGGGASAQAQAMLDEIRANVPGVLSSDTGALNMTDDIAAARLLRAADRWIDLRLNQIDPYKRSAYMVERWEGIMGIVPSYGATWTERRRAIAAREARAQATSTGTVDAVVADCFSPLRTRVIYTDKDDAVMWWPGGTSTADLFWYSTVAHVVVEYVITATTTQAEIDRRVTDCLNALDELLPAWATFDCSQTPDFGPTANLFGFYLDRPNLDVAALT